MFKYNNIQKITEPNIFLAFDRSGIKAKLQVYLKIDTIVKTVDDRVIRVRDGRKYYENISTVKTFFIGHKLENIEDGIEKTKYHPVHSQIDYDDIVLFGDHMNSELIDSWVKLISVTNE